LAQATWAHLAVRVQLGACCLFVKPMADCPDAPALEGTEDILHGHDQDAYRDYVLRLWMEFQIQSAAQQQQPNVPDPMLPAFQQANIPACFGLLGDKGGMHAWARFAGISVLCLDFNRNVRLAHKGKLPGRQGWSGAQHFESIRARWLREVNDNTVPVELRQFLAPLRFVQTLDRYRERSISGFVAYHPGDDYREPELHVIIQGSYLGMKDTLFNAMASSTHFTESLHKLGLQGEAVATRGGQLKQHCGYAKIARQLYRQVQVATTVLEAENLPVTRIVVSGHSLGSAAGAGLLKLLKASGREVQGFLFAQPDSFKHGPRGSHQQRLDDECMMRDCVLNIHNTNDPVVAASEWRPAAFQALGTHVHFDGAPFVGAVRPDEFVGRAASGELH